jgi:MazG family protein
VPPRKRKLKRNARHARLRAQPKSAQKAKPAWLPANKSPLPRLRSEPIGKLFENLVAIQARLRAPGGCPWDREQTHATLRTYLVEEAYEVLDALERGDPRELAEELGDLLLQVLFHADIAREAGSFDISEVVAAIRDKMVRRHPHVFGDVQADTAGEVLKNWAKLKAKEKKSALAAEGDEIPAPPSALDGVPRHLPALLEAYQLTRKAAHVGFDWDYVEGILEKMSEEVGELESELQTAKGTDSSTSRTEEEVGDILFVAVNLARFLKFDPEVALKKSNIKFKARFQWMESEAARRGIRLEKMPKEKLEELWDAAKSHLEPEIDLARKP